MFARVWLFAMVVSLAAVVNVGCCGPRGMGCGSSCGECCDGRAYAGQIYKGCGTPKIPYGVCTGPRCCDTGCEPGCGCEPACGCEASCACEPACGAEPACGCEPACGVAADCGCGCPPSRGLFGFGGIMGCLFGNTGCSSDIYWDEWHCDPPRCCDPCNRCGQWVGPPGAPVHNSCNCN
jgi:hypothetical protein